MNQLGHALFGNVSIVVSFKMAILNFEDTTLRAKPDSKVVAAGELLQNIRSLHKQRVRSNETGRNLRELIRQ